MTAQTALAAASDFYTVEGAAHRIGVTPRTVRRMIEAGTLTAQYPIGGPGERRPVLLLAQQVAEVATARQVIKGAR